MPKISIIVPVYNVEKYLHQCIDSVLAQTFTDWELLLIDDGSPDRSGEICDDYAVKDSRIRVFHKPNGGVSSARNLGLDNAHGEYITFLDSDDWLEPTYLSDFLIVDNDADLYLQGYSDFFKNKISQTKQFPFTGVFYDFSTTFCYGEDNNMLNSPVCKLFRRNIVKSNKIQFDLHTSYGEDHLFVLDFLFFCNSIGVSNKVGYVYNHHEESLTSRNIPYKELLYYTNNGSYKLLKFVHAKKISGYDCIFKKWYASNIIKTILSYFDNVNKDNTFKDFKQLPFNPIDKSYTPQSLFHRLFKMGFIFPSFMSYLYFKLLSRTYKILRQ